MPQLVRTQIVTGRTGDAEIIILIAFDPARVAVVEAVPNSNRCHLSLDTGEECVECESVESFDVIVTKINAARKDT
jgi:hypothetical protein